MSKESESNGNIVAYVITRNKSVLEANTNIEYELTSEDETTKTGQIDDIKDINKIVFDNTSGYSDATLEVTVGEETKHFIKISSILHL